MSKNDLIPHVVVQLIAEKRHHFVGQKRYRGIINIEVPHFGVFLSLY